MTEDKKREVEVESKECQACEVLGDYMCAGMPDGRPQKAALRAGRNSESRIQNSE